MIDKVKFRELVEAWEATRKKCESGFRERELLYWFMLEHASDLLALVEEVGRLREALKRMLLEFDFLIESGNLSDIRDDIIFVQARAALSQEAGS